MRSRLKELMERDGVNQKDLAAQTGISPTTIGKVYRNQFTRIDCDTVLKLYKRFNCSTLTDLLEVEE